MLVLESTDFDTNMGAPPTLAHEINNYLKTINIENLSSGVYVFRVVTDNGVAMRKVVKK